MLLFVQLLQVEQRVLILRVEAQHLVERFERAIDEAAALEIEAEAEQHIGVLGSGQLRPLQQGLVNLDGARDLAALAVDVAEDQVNLERVGIDPRRLAQLFDGDVDLIRDQEVQPEHVVMRIARAAAIDPLAVAQLVALPGLADGEAGQQRQQRGEKGDRLHASDQVRRPQIVQVNDALDAALVVDHDDRRDLALLEDVQRLGGQRRPAIATGWRHDVGGGAFEHVRRRWPSSGAGRRR